MTEPRDDLARRTRGAVVVNVEKIETATTRTALRRDIATDIYRSAQHAPMTLTADGGELAAMLAELALRRVETAGYIAPWKQAEVRRTVYATPWEDAP